MRGVEWNTEEGSVLGEGGGGGGGGEVRGGSGACDSTCVSFYCCLFQQSVWVVWSNEQAWCSLCVCVCVRERERERE